MAIRSAELVCESFPDRPLPPPPPPLGSGELDRMTGIDAAWFKLRGLPRVGDVDDASLVVAVEPSDT